MIENKRILAIIPARGGSKGIKDKNIVDVYGKPLIAYTLEAALKSKYIDRVIVSTDSIKIKDVSLEHGGEVPFIRPKEISHDRAKSIDVIKHALEVFKEQGVVYDFVVFLQPTSPLRRTVSIDKAIEEIIDKQEGSLVSVCKCDKSPILMREIQEGKMKEILSYKGDNLRRQELPVYYSFNGAIYINTVDMINKKGVFVDDDTIPFIMSEEESIDIDSPVDLVVAKYYIERREKDGK